MKDVVLISSIILLIVTGDHCVKPLKEFNKALVFTDSEDKATSLIDLAGGSFTSEKFLYHFGIQTPASIDYVPREDRVYWSDILQGMILSAFSNGTSMKTLFSCDVISPIGIVIDRAGRNLFWTDSGTKRIEVGRLDGTKRKVLISVHTDKPKAIVLDIPHGFMYWTDVGKNPKIERAAMDGTARQIIVNKNLGLPTGLAMDQTTNRLYWIDAELDRIEEFNLNTRSRKVIRLYSTDVSPFALTMYQGWLYWTDWQTKSISRVSANGGNEEVILTGLKRPMDLFVYDSASSDSGPCLESNGLCSDFCLLNPTGYNCACSTGIALLPDGKNCDYESFNKASSEKFLLFAGSYSGKIYKIPLSVHATPCYALNIGRNITYPIAVDYDPVEEKVYWTDGRLKAIMRAAHDGSSVEVIVQQNVQIPDGLAIDWIGRNLYWSDVGTKRIDVSKLDGSSRRSIITTDIEKPRSIALDTSGRNMFWTDWGSSPKIERTNMDGTARTVLVNSGIVWVNAVALDVKNKFLYWCDAKLDRIERMDFQGNNRTVVFQFYNPVGGGFFHQFGLAVDDDILYWTDWVRKSVIEYNSKTRFLSFMAEWKGIIRPMGLHLHDSQKFHKVVKCESLTAPSNGILLGCEGETTEDYLTTCRLSCLAGYRGSGSEVRTCLRNSTWSGRNFTCHAIRCPRLSMPSKALLLSPSCGNLYGANCVFGCQYGYASNSGNVTRTCSLSSKWSGRPINCKDVRPPSFGDTCPTKPHLVYTKSSQFLAFVNWTVPVATDNSGIPPEVRSTKHPPRKMAEGVHMIVYTATDASGNKAFCRITIKVAVIHCTSMNVQSGGPLRMSNCGNYNGAECNFSCAVGHRLNGSSITKCVAPGNRPPGIWSNPLPSCEVIRCDTLPSPINGSKIGCSSHVADVYGTRCSFFCNAGYYLTGSSERHCMENGTWSGQISVCKAIECDALDAPTFGALSPASCLSKSSFGQECIFTCNNGYTLEGTSSRACGNGGNWTGENYTVCKDLSAPTFNHTCPNDMVFYTGTCDKRAAVSWSDPVATDNSETVVLTYPAIRPPVNLTIGLYKVLYTAADKSGNSANCSFAVQVTRITCPNLHPPRHGIINSLSCGSYFGSHATLSCNTGYQLSGSHFRSCQLNGTWSGKTTKCNVVRCPSIQAPVHGDVSPDACKSHLGAQYGESCVFTCNSSNGYQLQGPQNVSCQGNGSWSTDIKQLFCQDIQRPDIKCPADIEADTDANQSYATVNWTVPVPTDNSNVALKAIGLYPPQTIKAGRNEITYAVEDSAGLSSSCKFTIHIKDTEPPRIRNCPSNLQIVSGKILSKVVLPPIYHTDNVGVTSFTSSIRNGSELTWGQYNITYTVSDKAGNTAECLFHISIAGSPCKDLPAPLNGAKACEMWLVGMHCTVHCNKGYGFSTAPKKLYFCSPKGQWVNAKVEGEEKPALPDCSKEHNPKGALVNGQIHYLTNECGDEQSKRTVARNFITLFKQHPFGFLGGCVSNEKCTIENVRVECGPRARQRRESLQKKQSSQLYLRVTFTIKVPVPKDIINSSQDFNETSQELSKAIAADLNKTKLDLNIGDAILQADQSIPPVISIAGFVCDKGQVRGKDRCVNCPVGHFHNASVSTCQTCPANHYQDKEAQSSCIPCPRGTFTHGKEASKSRHDCRACPQLGEPFKGYKSCSKAFRRVVCTLHCHDGNSFHVDAETTFTCGPVTKWRWNGLKKVKLPTCSSDFSPAEIKHRFSLKFPGIQCPERQYLKQLPNLIQQKVKKVLNSVPGCSFAGECNTQAAEMSQCNTGNEPLTILFLVSIKKSYSALKATIEETSKVVLFELLYTLSTERFGVHYSGNYMTGNIAKISTQLKCSPGSILNSSRKGCVACPVGTFYDRESVKCKPCGSGLYQDKEGQTSCLSYSWYGSE